MVSIHRPLGYEPSTLPLRHPAYSNTLLSIYHLKLHLIAKRTILYLSGASIGKHARLGNGGKWKLTEWTPISTITKLNTFYEIFRKAPLCAFRETIVEKSFWGKEDDEEWRNKLSLWRSIKHDPCTFLLLLILEGLRRIILQTSINSISKYLSLFLKMPHNYYF